MPSFFLCTLIVRAFFLLTKMYKGEDFYLRISSRLKLKQSSPLVGNTAAITRPASALMYPPQQWQLPGGAFCQFHALSVVSCAWTGPPTAAALMNQ